MLLDPDVYYFVLERFFCNSKFEKMQLVNYIQLWKSCINVLLENCTESFLEYSETSRRMQFF